MSDSPTDSLSPEKQALLALRKMRAKLEELERARTEPIAIIGLGCRFPGGAVDGESFWRILEGGVDAVTEIPRDRFDVDALYDPDPDARGRIYTRRGGFVSDIDRFDAPFFGIARREAVSLDPQQRMLLEVAWEALENAGQPPDRLHGTKTGVFMGISSGDYAQLQMQRGDRAALDLYFGTGSAPSATACRISYVLGLVGPSIAVDTACSASLVAVHLASQSLRAGECRLALAGGVNLNILPEIFINLCMSKMLAPDGRCKTFDAAADGYVRGEGCGVIVLKRLSDALNDGDRVLALLRSTAINQDGRSGGFTAPSELSQEELLREAVARAGIAATDVGYVEAHGTGTPLGDPIEMQAIASVLCAGRPADRPLAVGSVKTNIGHLEAAAGIAGLIKVVLALRHKTIPPNLHLTRLNPHLALDGAPVVVPTEPLKWQSDGRPRIAGVSSFGFTGTNAHAILEEAPEPERAAPGFERPVHVLALSARTEAALGELADRFERYLASAEAPLADVCFTANAGRTHFAHRLAVVGRTTDDVRASIGAWRGGAARPGTYWSKAGAQAAPDVAFLFTGQGAQYAGMGRQLCETQPVFRQALQRCDELLRPHLAEPLLSVIYPEAGDSPLLDQTLYTQPALFALEYALAELWMSWGIEPAFVMGHSLGEYVAACVAGLFSLEDGLRLVAARARLMQSLPAGGAMAAVFVGEAEARRALAGLPGHVSIAAVNGPQHVVLSGDGAAVREALARLAHQGVRAEALKVSHAFHSGLMEPILDEFERIAGEITWLRPRTAIVSNLTGALADPADMSSPSYWRRHLREPVLFAAGMRTLYEHGARAFLEVGPSPTLLAMGRRVVADETVSWLPTLRRGREDWTQVADTLARLYADQVSPDWARFDAAYARRKLTLPTYPFQRQSYWIEPAAADATAAARPATMLPAPALREHLYEVAWEESPAPQDGEQPCLPPVDRWLIFADRRGLGAELARQLGPARSRLVRAGQQHRALPDGAVAIDPARAEDYAWAIDGAGDGEGTAPVGVVYLWAAEEECPGGCEGLLALAKALTARRGASRLWIATRGAQPAGGAPSSIGLAPVWGFGRVLSLEHPELFGGLVDLEPGPIEDEARALLQAIASADEEQVAIRSGRRLAPRLVRAAPAARGTLECSADASYLITGGLGSLGLKVAGWMVERGARHLVLVGRRGLPDRARWNDLPPGEGLAEQVEAVRRLEARGVEVTTYAADVADRARMASIVSGLAAGPHPLCGVVHAAGVSNPALIRDLDPKALEATLRPKVDGARVLHEVTAGLRLDFFVLFSSISSVWGSKGLAHYAAANHFLDALAQRRRADGLPALSVNWGPWADGGMTTDSHRRTLEALGVAALPPATALAALDHLLASGAAQATVAQVDWNVFRPVYEAQRGRRLLERIETAARHATADRDRSEALRRQLNGARPADRMALLVAAVQREVATVLGDGAGGALPEPHVRFFEIGMDSLMAVELRRRMESLVGRPLPASLAFDYPTVARLSEYLAGAFDVEPAGAPEPAVARAAAAEALASVADLSEEEVERLFAERVLNSGA